ncbi:hypothetical protein SOMG_03428 [Schizosaccharomyces osmophilus]|uniref:Uncharacterized protein n=1 Tax=Schizosaccharomyces osmophilus TaxID=2545709 RepID=A0AAF0AX17_9SCHI|nr:uncharacterized protein SOMG_03428 [Schizosaccharomyces osmophilus]WBW73848.1 hypothetical protein SOMG_03428 [Schizosaccharomyces osmophilus]
MGLVALVEQLTKYRSFPKGTWHEGWATLNNILSSGMKIDYFQHYINEHDLLRIKILETFNNCDG